MSQKGVIPAVMQLKETLSKELVKLEKSVKDNIALSSAFYERCLDILQRLDEQVIDINVLCKTLVGTVVSKFKKCPDEPVATKAKILVKKWKDLAKEADASVADTVKNSQPTKTKDAKQYSALTPAAKRNAKAVSDGGKGLAAPDEWKTLPPLRRNIRAKLLEILYSDKSPNPSDLFALTAAVESEMDKCCRDAPTYKEKARSLSFNLKRNKSLRSSVLSGSVQPAQLVKLSPEELATSEKKKEREDLEKSIQDSRRLDWEQANEEKINEMCGIKGDLLKASLFTCGRCKSIKTTSTQKQTRSADEPMTVFVLCMNCGNRWKC